MLVDDTSIRGVMLSGSCFQPVVEMYLVTLSFGLLYLKRVNGGKIIGSSSWTWEHMSRKISCSPGNTKGGAGWRNCQSWFCVVPVLQACHAAGSLSESQSSHGVWGNLDLLYFFLHCRGEGVGKGWDRYQLGHPAVEVLA